MTTPGEPFPDVPVDSAIAAEIERVKNEKIFQPRVEIADQALENYDVDLPDYIADLSYYGEQSEQTLSTRLTTLQWQRTYFDFAKESEVTAVQQTDLLEPEKRESQRDCIELSRMFIGLVHQTAQELTPGSPESTQAESLTALLRLEGRDPFKMMLRWNVVANVILAQSRKIMQTMALQMRPHFSPQENLEVYNDVEKHFDLQYAHYIPGVRILERFIRSPKHDTRHIPKDLRADYVALYNEWQAAMRSDANHAVADTLNALADQEAYFAIMQHPEQFEAGLTATADAIASAEERQNKVDPIEEETRLLHQELQAIIEAHAKKSTAFRPTWHQVQKQGPGIRLFSNELLRLSREENDAPPSKRITRLLHALEYMGSATGDPTALHEQFTAQLVVEFMLKDKIKTAQEALGRVGMRADLSGWEPVSDDLDFVVTHWKDWIVPTALEHWSPKTGTRNDAIAAMEAALTQYKRAKREWLHPEERLAEVARRLGVVALPAEARPQTAQSNRELKRLAVKTRFKEIREDAMTPDDMRERATVIEHFLGLAESQWTPADDPNFGELFLTERSEHHDKRYFGVRFRDEHQKEWVILESLSLETATYIIPMDVVRSLGTLEDFLAGFGKTAQIALGSEYAQHSTGWTAGTHIARIMTKLSKAQPK